MARIASRRLRLIAPVLGLASALVLSGCAAGKISQTADQVAAIDGANGTVQRLGVRDARLPEAPPGGYPAGADVPLLFWLTNSSVNSDTLASITTPAASGVMLSAEAKVLGNNKLEVGQGTPVTATVTGLAEALPYGHSIPVTFTFAGAGSVTVEVPITIPVERTDVRPTVNILPAHGEDLWFSEGEHGAEGEGEHGTEGEHAEETGAAATGAAEAPATEESGH